MQLKLILSIVITHHFSIFLTAQVQVPPICTGSPTPTTYCEEVCVSCSGLNYLGSSAGWVPSSAQGFCGVVSNNQWLAFVAGAAQATARLSFGNCQNGDGLQLAVYEDCMSAPIACGPGQAGGGPGQIDLDIFMVPGKTYYLMVDGYNGDACDFDLSIFPPSASVPPPVGAGGALQGPATLCPGGTVSYSLPADVAGAGYYQWTAPPGWLINGLPAPLTLAAPAGRTVNITAGQSSGQLSVLPFNACMQGAAVSRNVSAVPIPPTILPARYVCPGDFPYPLPWGDWAGAPGIFSVVLTSWLGCDSMVRQQLILVQVCDVGGKVYADFNNNGLFDGTDVGLENTIVRTTSGAFTTTNLAGDFFFPTLPLGDTIRPMVTFSGVNVAPAYYLRQGGSQTNLDFAVSGIFGQPDISVFLQNTQVFRPGFSTMLTAAANNISLSGQNNVVLQVQLPPFLVLENSTPAFSYQIGDSLYWEAGTLDPGQIYSVKLQVLTPSATALGTVVDLKAWAKPLNDFNPLNNIQQLSKLVVGSYDPNDKEVAPAFVTPALLANRPRLEYTIRFQNTGNFPADFVKIIDTLQGNLEPTSFQFTAASHPCTWKLKEPGIVEFLFSDINLPDSLSNAPESHGFVQFSMRPKSGLDIGDQLDNFTDIYFDFNPPVRTNTTTTQVVHFLPGDPPGGASMDVRPNPANYVVHLGWAPALPQAGTLRLFTRTGVLLQETIVPAGTAGLDVYVADWPNDLYIAQLTSGTQQYVQQFIVQHTGGTIRRLRQK